MTKFNDFAVSENVLQAVSNMGFEEATPIQEQAIPTALKGLDLIGQAHTGTGKTAAFGVPMVEKLEKNGSTVQALVVTPTRELAVQVAEELNKIGQYKGIRTLPVYGGQDIGRQIRGLQKRPQIIVGTPGRLLDHIRRRTVRLGQVSMVVLDEADEMLNMGFIEDIEAILQETPQERQTLLFSATMPGPIEQLARRFMRDPQKISVRSKEVTVPNTEQFHMVMEERQKFDVLCRLLDTQSPDLAIVFGRTKRRVDELYEALNKRGYSAEGIHGDMTQARRDSVMRQFKDGSIDILVATDVAARGLDITGVTHVYNFDIPQDPESYVHRIGRTGRAGNTGMAVTFVSNREVGHLRTIEYGTKSRIPRLSTPTVKEAIEGQQRIAVEKLLKTVESEDITHYQPLADELLNEHDAETILAAALKMLTKEPDTTPVKLTEEAPQWSKRQNKPYQGGHYRRNKHKGGRGRRPYNKK
ncbi:DEAD/DEAH box helicase [Dethiobacter alkaliphilus]|uniref:ATP-dependent RNA helicase CshA n=1 Tax=Dethiobacter alkaliphilus AHT 1 TaxID=555088 RepID=C0GIC6_DETAL|nr:DEAD/DEAH box helicase [Dethiobacter alkaliphilus]EEG76974.1 DEAD/DEAH box helicase domain protein [Dethiobacter alkaliphilus AHT 1]